MPTQTDSTVRRCLFITLAFIFLGRDITLFTYEHLILYLLCLALLIIMGTYNLIGTTY